MRFTIQYIPLSKIRPNLSQKMTEHMKKLQRLMWDCMYILVVKKNRKDGTYTIISGQERFESLKKHTKSVYAPCIVDHSSSTGILSWFQRLRTKQPLDDFPLMPVSWSIFRSFLKQEPRFRTLTRAEQIRVMLIAAHYKKTVLYTMKNAVDQILRSD